MRRRYLGLALIAFATAACPQEDFLLTGTQAFGNGGGGTGQDRLEFSQEPSAARVNQVITPAILVTVLDSLGRPDTTFAFTVNVGINLNPTGGNLTGTITVAPVNGVASFGNLAIDKAGNGYSLITTAPNATSATSTGFNITP
jgi:hypothetical protein